MIESYKIIKKFWKYGEGEVFKLNNDGPTWRIQSVTLNIQELRSRTTKRINFTDFRVVTVWNNLLEVFANSAAISSFMRIMTFTY